MNYRKYFWALRAFIYKLNFKKIGNYTYIGRPLFLAGCKNISIGDRVRIFPGVRLEAIDSGRIEIGSNLAIEQNVQIVSAQNTLRVGNDVTIAANVFISNVDHNYSLVSSSVMDQGNTVRDTSIGEGCFIGYGAVILPGTRLGTHCVVGSNSVLKGDYGDNVVIVGAPGEIIKRYNAVTLRWEKVRK